MSSREQRPAQDCSAVLLPGNVIGSYRIIESIGEGGMGRVYLAEHVRLGRTVALKVLREEYNDKRELIHRFFSEARAVNQIEHENILEVTDFVEDRACGIYYIVMERLRGFDLLDLIDREGALPPLRAINIARQIASALAAAHNASIIHRDLKPENIFLIERTGHRDFVKILDFGVAKLLQAQDNNFMGVSVHQTSPGAMIGTPTYMSPEQACGQEIDARSDIYSLGVILYEMVTGDVPFKGHSFGELVVKHTVMEPPIPSQREDLTFPVDPQLEALILRCLQKDVADRPDDMAEVKQELDGIQRRLQRGIGVPGESSLSPLPPRDPDDEEREVSISISESLSIPPEEPRRVTSKLVIGAATILGVLIGGVAAVFLLIGDGESAETRVEETALQDHVSIDFETTPAGAVVHDGEDGPALGETPLTKRFDRADSQREFVFKLAGYTPLHARVSFDRDARVAVVLTPEPASETPAAGSEPEPEPTAPREPPPRESSRAAATQNKSGRRGSVESSDSRPRAVPSSSDSKVQRRGVLDPFAD